VIGIGHPYNQTRRVADRSSAERSRRLPRSSSPTSWGIVMASSAPTPWQPTTIRRFIKAFPTGAATVLVQTDQGKGYLKALGNPEGPHVLACEWVGTQLARWLGLLTFDFALITVTTDDDLPYTKGGKAQPGPAFITRKERGNTWGGGKRALGRLANPNDLTRLVLLDTWLRNCDRHPLDPQKRKPNRDNVFLSREGAPPRRALVKAMDHTHCFTCGRELTARLADISCVKEEGCYGLFPEFWPYLNQDVMRETVQTLRDITPAEVRQIVESIPGEWEVSRPARDAWRSSSAAAPSSWPTVSRVGFGRSESLIFRPKPERKRTHERRQRLLQPDSILPRSGPA
jgi:hypothetical protein